MFIMDFAWGWFYSVIYRRWNNSRPASSIQHPPRRMVEKYQNFNTVYGVQCTGTGGGGKQQPTVRICFLYRVFFGEKNVQKKFELLWGRRQIICILHMLLSECKGKISEWVTLKTEQLLFLMSSATPKVRLIVSIFVQRGSHIQLTAASVSICNRTGHTCDSALESHGNVLNDAHSLAPDTTDGRNGRVPCQSRTWLVASYSAYREYRGR